jgi:hypothetical protein
VAGYLFFALRGLWGCRPYFGVRYWARSLSWAPLLALVPLALAFRHVVADLGTKPGHYEVQNFLAMMGWEALARPLVSVVAHVVFFGPVVLLGFLHIRGVCAALHPYGLGLVLCFTANLFLSLESESRHLFHFFPLLVPFVVKAATARVWRARDLLLFAALCLAWSKVWFRMGGLPDPFSGRLFPAQRFWMHIGPLMSRDMYQAHAAAALLTAAVLGLMVWRQTRSAQPFGVSPAGG